MDEAELLNAIFSDDKKATPQSKTQNSLNRIIPESSSLADQGLMDVIMSDHVEPVLLSATYQEHEIEKLISFAVNGGLAICFLLDDPDKRNQSRMLYQKLTPSNVLKVWQSKPNSICCKFELWNGIVIEEDVNLDGLLVNKYESDLLLFPSKNKYPIRPLTPKQLNVRREQIEKLRSAEKRANMIKDRGDEVYKELHDLYKLKCNQTEIAQYIREEERPIYEALNYPLPALTTYVKHIRKPTKSRK